MRKLQSYDIIIKCYERLHSSNYYVMKLFSPIRKVLREFAYIYLPWYLSKHSSIKTSPVDDKIIVSFTSFPARIDAVWQVVACMLRQTVSPYKIILWLSKDQFSSDDILPDSLRNMQNDIFEIRYKEGDLCSHKKYQYVCCEYPNDLVLLVDDDIYYPSDFIEKFYNAYKRGKEVVAAYGCLIQHDENGSIKKYSEWPTVYDELESNDFFFGSGGGVLFKPSYLYKDLTDINLALQLCPSADDIWLNAMVRLGGKNIFKIESGLIFPIKLKDNKNTLSVINLEQDKNDQQLMSLNNYYYYYLKRWVF